MATTSATPFARNPAGHPLPDGAGTPPARPESELMNRVVQGAHQAIDRVADGAAPAVERIEQGVATAGSALHARADQAREIGDEWAESLRTTIRENPLASVGTALLVGVLAARLTAR